MLIDALRNLSKNTCLSVDKSKQFTVVSKGYFFNPNFDNVCKEANVALKLLKNCPPADLHLLSSFQRRIQHYSIKHGMTANMAELLETIEKLMEPRRGLIASLFFHIFPSLFSSVLTCYQKGDVAPAPKANVEALPDIHCKDLTVPKEGEKPQGTLKHFEDNIETCKWPLFEKIQNKRLWGTIQLRKFSLRESRKLLDTPLAQGRQVQVSLEKKEGYVAKSWLGFTVNLLANSYQLGCGWQNPFFQEEHIFAGEHTALGPVSMKEGQKFCLQSFLGSPTPLLICGLKKMFSFDRDNVDKFTTPLLTKQEIKKRVSVSLWPTSYNFLAYYLPPVETVEKVPYTAEMILSLYETFYTSFSGALQEAEKRKQTLYLNISSLGADKGHNETLIAIIQILSAEAAGLKNYRLISQKKSTGRALQNAERWVKGIKKLQAQGKISTMGEALKIIHLLHFRHAESL